MTLENTITYPAGRRYVLKIHRDAAPGKGVLRGRVENMSTGEHFDFSTADELLTRLIQDLMQPITSPETQP